MADEIDTGLRYLSSPVRVIFKLYPHFMGRGGSPDQLKGLDHPIAQLFFSLDPPSVINELVLPVETLNPSTPSTRGE